MIGNLECPSIPELAEDYKGLLRKWSGNEITPQFDIDICELAVKHKACIEDFRFKPLPTPSQEYRKFKFLSKEEKEEFIKKNFNFYEENIKNFLDSVDMAKNRNDRNREQLVYWLKLNISENARNCVEKALDTYSR